jgi:hypothetical protein
VALTKVSVIDNQFSWLGLFFVFRKFTAGQVKEVEVKKKKKRVEDMW